MCQVRDRDAALRGGKVALQQALRNQGSEVDTSGYKGRRTSVRLDIDPEAAQRTPSYQYAAGEP
jgi:hypothetical protein